MTARLFTRPRRAAAMTNLAVLAALGILLFAGAERVLLAPCVTLCVIALWFVMTLWMREGGAALFESGTMWMLATTAYGAIPMIGFAMMRGQWSELADGRLAVYDFNRSELAHLGWNYVIYTISFIAPYLAARGRRPLRMGPLRRPSNVSIVTIVAMLIGIEAVTIALRVVYQYDLETGYAQLEQFVENARHVPHVVLQFSHVVLDAKLVVQQAILALIF